ncbi:hypothetical protein ACFLXT_00525 [Chloroflexota bacterium]
MTNRCSIYFWAIALALVVALPAFLILPALASPTGIVNGSFETGDLTGWNISGLGGHVEVLGSSNFAPEITVLEGSHFAFLSNGPGEINDADGPDLDGNGLPDSDSAILSQNFTLSSSEVPTTLSFQWSFLTSEFPFEPYDDFFMVNLNDAPILTGSVPGMVASPFPDVSPLDGTTYIVSSPGLTDGSGFDEGRSDFQTFYYHIYSPGDYTLQFLVADQYNHYVDSGLLIDKVTVGPPHVVGGTVVAESIFEVIMPWIAVVVLITGMGVWLWLWRRRGVLQSSKAA